MNIDRCELSKSEVGRGDTKSNYSYRKTTSAPTTPHRQSNSHNCSETKSRICASAPTSPQKKKKLDELTKDDLDSIEDDEVEMYGKAFEMQLIYKYHKSEEDRLERMLNTYREEMIELERNHKEAVKKKNQAAIHRTLLLKGNCISNRNEIEDNVILNKTNSITTTVAHRDLKKELEKLQNNNNHARKGRSTVVIKSIRKVKSKNTKMSQSTQNAADALLELVNTDVGYYDSNLSDVHSENSPDDMKEWLECKL